MRARRQAGFSLLELVVSTAVLMLVMLLSLQMLGETGRLYSGAQIEFAEPSLDLATRWLRRDAQGASHLGPPSHEPVTGPLELVGNDEGRIRYEKIGTNLDRVILGMLNEELGRRTVMRGVVHWQWQALDIGLLEVELIHQHRAPRPWARFGGAPAELRLMSERHRFALRGLPRSYW